MLDAVLQLLSEAPGYLPFLSFLAARFSFSDFSGFFFSVFFWSMPFMWCSPEVVCGRKYAPVASPLVPWGVTQGSPIKQRPEAGAPGRCAPQLSDQGVVTTARVSVLVNV